MSYEAPILILQMAIVLSVPAAAVYVSSISMSMRIEQACPFTACPCSSLRLTQVCRLVACTLSIVSVQSTGVNRGQDTTEKDTEQAQQNLE